MVKLYGEIKRSNKVKLQPLQTVVKLWLKWKFSPQNYEKIVLRGHLRSNSDHH